LDEEVGAEQPLKGKAILHGSNLNREVSHLDVPKRQALDALGKDELDTADSDYATDSICWFGDDSQSGDLINCEHRGGRAGIEENPLQHKFLSAPAELDRDEWKPVLQPDFQEAARIPAQWTSSISTVSLSVCRTYSSR
jgi:hypothetical protein